MDNLGVSMNAASIQAYALEKGINFDWNTADQAAKSEVAMAMFMDRTTQYAGNFAKESSTTFTGSLGAMQSAFTDTLAAMTTGQGIGPALEALGGSVVTFAQNLLPMISSVIAEIPTVLVNLLTSAGPGLIESGMKMITDLALGLAQSLPTLIPQAIAAITTILDGLMANLPMLIDAGIQLLLGLAIGLVNAIPTLITYIPTIITSLVNALIGATPMLVEAGVQLLVAIVQNLPAIISGIVKAIPQIINGMITALGKGVGEFVKMGEQLLAGLATGIGNAIGGVINKAKEAAGKVVGAVKGFFGINSPSKVFMGIGANLDEGMAMGIADNVKPITKAMDDVNKLTQRSFESEIGLNTSTPSALGGLNASLSGGQSAVNVGGAVEIRITGNGSDQLNRDPRFLEQVKSAILTEITQGNRSIPNRTSLIPIGV